VNLADLFSLACQKKDLLFARNFDKFSAISRSLQPNLRLLTLSRQASSLLGDWAGLR
jgi:predicted protein tyrosine phosphatase